MTIWNIVFYLSSSVMLIASFGLIFVKQPMHGAVYLITSLLALSIDFYLLGSPFIAILQVILYVGAIMVLYVFFIMMNPPKSGVRRHHQIVIIPLILLIILTSEIIYMLSWADINLSTNALQMIAPKKLGEKFFGSYKIAIEAISTLLLVALIGVIQLAAPFKIKTNVKRIGEKA